MPSSFEGYEIRREIQRGGQGVVYEARQKSTRRRVAIKVLKEGPFASERDRIRFEREVQILGRLCHPGVVSVLHSGQAYGSFYFVMDYISGDALDDYVRKAELSIDAALKLFVKICEGVNAAHLHGIMHRDLKPSNIRIDGQGVPHILDFGLAKVTTNESDGSHITMTGQFMGSLPWASPEQAGGSADRIDLRSDVYSLGVILYQMLTGRLPHAIDRPMQQVLRSIVEDEPMRPSRHRTETSENLGLSSEDVADLCSYR